MTTILWWLFYFVAAYVFLYALIPGFISRVFGFRAFQRGQAEREIALTFDDGPDPVYTPKLLDLLRRYEAKATFFVVGAHAEQNPELIRRMHEEGHSFGIHNYVHRSNWIMTPWTVLRHVKRTASIIESITGVRPLYYRPPWGIVNAFDFVLLRRWKLVLWTSMFGDWSEKVGVEGLYRRMRKHLVPGRVFVLHDRGDTFGADPNAPAHMLAALERILIDCRESGPRFVGVDKLIALTAEARRIRPGMAKRAVLAVWMLWEKLFHIVFRVRTIHDGTFMHYRPIKYSGETIELRDGTTIAKGDLVFEIHFDNGAMHDIGSRSKSAVQTAIKLVRETERMLPHVARELLAYPRSGEVKGLFGISMINRGADNLGFDTFALPRGLFAWLTNRYLRLLMRVIHPNGGDKIARHGEKLEPRVIAMSRDVLLMWQDPAAAAAVLRAQRRQDKTGG